MPALLCHKEADQGNQLTISCLSLCIKATSFLILTGPVYFVVVFGYHCWVGRFVNLTLQSDLRALVCQQAGIVRWEEGDCSSVSEDCGAQVQEVQGGGGGRDYGALQGQQHTGSQEWAQLHSDHTTIWRDVTWYWKYSDFSIFYFCKQLSNNTGIRHKHENETFR